MTEDSETNLDQIKSSKSDLLQEEACLVEEIRCYEQRIKEAKDKFLRKLYKRTFLRKKNSLHLVQDTMVNLDVLYSRKVCANAYRMCAKMTQTQIESAKSDLLQQEANLVEQIGQYEQRIVEEKDDFLRKLYRKTYQKLNNSLNIVQETIVSLDIVYRENEVYTNGKRMCEEITNAVPGTLKEFDKRGYPEHLINSSKSYLVQEKARLLEEIGRYEQRIVKAENELRRKLYKRTYQRLKHSLDIVQGFIKHLGITNRVCRECADESRRFKEELKTQVESLKKVCDTELAEIMLWANADTEDDDTEDDDTEASKQSKQCKRKKIDDGTTN